MQVVLERSAVWAGDVVRGTAYFHNNTRPVNYDAVYVEVSALPDAARTTSAGSRAQRREAPLAARRGGRVLRPAPRGGAPEALGAYPVAVRDMPPPLGSAEPRHTAHKPRSAQTAARRLARRSSAPWQFSGKESNWFQEWVGGGGVSGGCGPGWRMRPSLTLHHCAALVQSVRMSSLGAAARA